MSNQGKRPPGRVRYVGDDVIEDHLTLAEITPLNCADCGHKYAFHISREGWPGPYTCTATGCDCKKHGEELRWTGVAQAPNSGSEQMSGPGAYIG